jgi:hypothetical protein
MFKIQRYDLGTNGDGDFRQIPRDSGEYVLFSDCEKIFKDFTRYELAQEKLVGELEDRIEELNKTIKRLHKSYGIE